MISRQMQKAKVYKLQTIEDDYGREKEDYVFIVDIDISINFVSINQQNQDIRFKEATNLGLTSYKELSNKDRYKIITNDSSYIVTSVNNIARLTVIYLKEVIVNE